MSVATVHASGAIDGLRARAILDPKDLQRYSFVRLADPRTALARGMKEYLEELSINWSHGRLLRFARVLVCWSEPEDPAKYPSAVVLGEGPAEYEDAEISPQLIQLTESNGDGTGRVLRKSCEIKQRFSLILWTTDPVERSGLIAMVEDAFEPTNFMTGLRLELPYYFNARATYEKLQLLFDDSELDAQRRWRRALMSITGVVEQLVPVGKMTELRTRLFVEVNGEYSGGET